MKIENIMQRLSSIRMTVVSGAFLLASLILMLTGVPVSIDPAWITIFISGLPLLYEALHSLLIEKKITSALLISVAMIASVSIGEIFAAGEVAFIMAIGEMLEDRTVEKAKQGIRDLVNMVPLEARKITESGNENTERMVSLDKIFKGDLIKILPGETIPVDAKIVQGSTSVDQSVITGESLPVDKGEGDEIFSGTTNRFGAVEAEMTKAGEDSSIQRLVKMVKQAEEDKAPMQKTVDKWASWLVPMALMIALVTYFILHDITRAVTVLVVFCPCALALATPTSIMAAIGQATKHGVIVKSGEALEQMGKVDTVAFDKTGTLTHGNLVLTDYISFSDKFSSEEVLKICASVESYSEHPIGKAAGSYVSEHSIKLYEIKNFAMIPGKGVVAEIESKEVICGNSEYLKEKNISINDDVLKTLDKYRKEGKATILVSNGGECIGIIAFSDTLRETAANMVRELKETGTDVVLLTGDHETSAKYFADKVSITDIYSELLPKEKVEKIKDLEKAEHIVCMIGDGVNDAPALKTASVGVAMGTMGSDIAIDAADIALMGDDISKVPYLKRLSNATISTIKFNITMSMVINFAAIILSIMGILNPITGALVHNAGSVLIVLNAARLYDRKF